MRILAVKLRRRFAERRGGYDRDTASFTHTSKTRRWALSCQGICGAGTMLAELFGSVSRHLLEHLTAAASR